MEESPPEYPSDDEPIAPPRQPGGLKPVSWLWLGITIVFIVLTIIVLLFGIFGSTSDNSREQSSDEQTRNAVIGALLDQLGQKTNGAIGVDNTGETFSWDGNGKVSLTLHIGNCKGVDAYADTPQRPDDTSQVTIHVKLPGGPSDAADLPLKSDADLKRMENALPQSSLKQCSAGDPRLQPAGG